MEKTKLINYNGKIHFRNDGNDYELENGKFYRITSNDYSDDFEMELVENISLPQQLYTPESDKKFIDKIINYHNSKTEGTTGVMLMGTKGTGKTVLAKEIAMASNMPIFIIDRSMHLRCLKNLFSRISENVCIIFDEMDKMCRERESDYVLKALDGIDTVGHNLVIMTCNEIGDIDDYILDRCSRIRYYKQFDEMPPSMIKQILEDRLDDSSNVKDITDFISTNFGIISFDNVAAFADEINAYPNSSYEELMEDMNISQR